jgi:hypothetical protein
MKKCNKCLFYIEYKCELGLDKTSCTPSIFKEKEDVLDDKFYLSEREMLKRNYYVDEPNYIKNKRENNKVRPELKLPYVKKNDRDYF